MLVLIPHGFSSQSFQHILPSALMRWAEYVEKTDWKSHAELKQAFPSADYVGNDRYVFNISGNKFRLVTIVVFFQGFLHIRFVGTHAEYDKIKDIKNI